MSSLESNVFYLISVTDCGNNAQRLEEWIVVINVAPSTCLYSVSVEQTEPQVPLLINSNDTVWAI